MSRKHCGTQPRWLIGLDTLRDKCGSGSTEKEFRRLIGKIIADDEAHGHMPDYVFRIENDNVVVRPKKKEIISPLVSSTLCFKDEDATYARAKRHAPGWDVRCLEGEWREWVHKKSIPIQNPDANFLSFCKARGPYK